MAVDETFCIAYLEICGWVYWRNEAIFLSIHICGYDRIACWQGLLLLDTEHAVKLPSTNKTAGAQHPENDSRLAAMLLMGTGLNNPIRTGQVGVIPCWMNKWLNSSLFLCTFYSLKMEDLTSFPFGKRMQQLLSNRSSGGMWNLLIPQKLQLWKMRPFNLPAPPEQLHEGLLPAIYFSGAIMVSSEPCCSFEKVQERLIFCFWYRLDADVHH